MLAALVRAHRIGERARGYVALTKPRIVLLLLATALPAMILAAKGWPSTDVVIALLLGGAMAAGGANALNCYLDRDIDRIMLRTRLRPIPTGQVSPGEALILGLVLGGVGVGLVQAVVGKMAAAMVLGSYLFYVLVYTLVLKRTTPLNIVIGGAAGAAPPLIGWVAVRGQVDWEGLILFGVVFMWTPVHFWALALNWASDYQQAQVPMLPVVASVRDTGAWISVHAVATLALSLALVWVDNMGPVYTAAAATLGAVFLLAAFVLYLHPTKARARWLFHYSNIYLFLLFAALAVDVFL